VNLLVITPLGLAHVLQERGHNAIFFVNDETIFSQYVGMHGFKAIKITPVLESGTAKHKKSNGFRFWKRLNEHAQAVRLKQDCLTDLIKRNSLDLCFLDSIYDDIYPYAVVLAEMGVPTILLSYTFASRFQTEYPPVFSSMVPPDTTKPKIRFRIIYTLLWAWTISSWGRAYAYDCFGYVKRAFRKRFGQIRNISFERKLRQFGWRSTWSEYKRRPLIPEIVFGHRMFDWPAIAKNPERCYFGTTDLFRKNFDFDWSIIESNNPIIYCNVSTLGFPKKRFHVAKRYLDVILDAFSQRKDWQLIIACGPFYQALRSDAYTPNIHIFERVQQLAVLAKADLAITWGGAGTIRECINFGVPMLVFPAWTDQFGNAARVLSCNVGIRGNMLNVTPKKMIEMVEQVLTDKKIHSSVREMRMQCNVKNEIQALVHFFRCHTALEL
jgi:UDP:flavonoid glycosyltransferase YjiC (YdhE family)